MASITETEDKLAIQELIARYNYALDSGDIEGYVNCFVDEGRLEIPFGNFTGVVALRQYITERAAERREHPLRHMGMSFIVDVQGTRAFAKCYFLLVQIWPEGAPRLLTSGIYHDELVKIGGTWRYSHHKVQVDSKAWAGQVFTADFLERNKLGGKG